MRRNLSILLLCLSLSAGKLCGQIIEIPDLVHTFEELQHADENCLVMFDVDETLIVPSDPLLWSSAREIFKKIKEKTLDNPDIVSPATHQKGFFSGQIMSRLDYQLVDAKVLEIITDLQKRQIKTIAFTKMMTGPLGIIPSMQDWRIKQLLERGFNFSQAFPDIKLHIIPELPSSGKSALYTHGILFANDQHKGPVLVAFLEQIGWTPKKVIFVDDRLDYLETVEASLKDTGIEFLGYHYTATHKHPPIDEELATLQLMHLAVHGLWLNHHEAKEQLQRKFDY